MKTKDEIEDLYGNWLYETYGKDITATAHIQALEMAYAGFLAGYFLAKKLEKNDNE